MAGTIYNLSGSFLVSLVRYFFLINLLSFSLAFQMMANQELTADTIIISRIKGTFIFDGKVDDECWENATSLPAIMQVPVFGQVPSQETDFLIAYDDNFVYVAGRMFDNKPGKLMTASRIRDEWTPQNDYLIWVFDTFNDDENGLIFATTPEGVRVDAAVLNDAINYENPYTIEWNTFWDVKTYRNEKGWFAEIRIPVSSLRFQPKDDKVTMGLIAMRYRPESSEIDIFPAISTKWSGVSWMKVSQARHVVFKGIKSKKPFYIAPYAIGGINQESELTSDGTTRKLNSDPEINGGLDVKYGITQNLTLDLSVNTDFAQVESDNAQINLTRFDLFFPEKRTFFLKDPVISALHLMKRIIFFTAAGLVLPMTSILFPYMAGQGWLAEQANGT